MAVLELKGLATPLLDPVSLRCEGPCCTLAGPSGSGKTLLLRALADLDPHRGQVLLDGVEQTQVPPREWRRRIAYLPAESHWWADRVAAHFPAPDPTTLARLGFEPDVLDWEVDRLSSGERQRLALARLLARGPRALLLDEPTANLDQTNRERVEDLVADYLRGGQALALWVSHDPEQARRVGTRHWRIAEGELREEAPGPWS
jgi:UDP-glucose/iron transport system ATP-binding protein